MIRLITFLNSFILLLYISRIQGEDPPTGELWYLDIMNAFAGNYGNAAAESMSRDYPVGATGGIENFGLFNFRLLSCDNLLGAMTYPFPLIVSPDAENSLINGYGKNPVSGNPIKNIFKKVIGYRALIHQCEYAIDDAVQILNNQQKPTGKWKETRRTKGTQSLKISINVEETGKVNIEDNGISVEFCRHDAGKQTCSVHRIMTSHSGGAGSGEHLYEFTVGTATMRRCSPWNDMCVEATIGTGNKPRFHFKVLPVKHNKLAPNALVEFKKEEKYCEMLMFNFRTKPDDMREDGKDVAVEDEPDVRGLHIYNACMLGPNLNPNPRPNSSTRAANATQTAAS